MAEIAASEAAVADSVAAEDALVERVTLSDRPIRRRPSSSRDVAAFTVTPAPIHPSPIDRVESAATVPRISPPEMSAPAVSQPETSQADISPAAPDRAAADESVVLRLQSLSKSYGDKAAVDEVDLAVERGSIFGLVGPNGAGKTTTLSMIAALLRPTSGRILLDGVDVWTQPKKAKRMIGVLPDRLRLFDRLTGRQLLFYSGVLRGLGRSTARSRSADLAQAFGLDAAMDRLVSDYSAGMTKKIAIAAAMIHTPKILVLDEPFEAVDPVSAGVVIDILHRYTAVGGTVILSSHSMELVQRVCDSVAIVVGGRVLSAGTLDQVRAGSTLEDRFVELAGGHLEAEGLEWLGTFSD